jgi:uncharacterized protein (TIGR02646 family)
MLTLPKLSLKKSLSKHLQQLENKVTQTRNFKDAVYTARQLWQQRKRKNSAQSVFNRIERQLQQQSNHCCYCEFNKGDSTEHYYPKNLFPYLCFDWSNLLWVCNDCNQRKGNKFKVFTSEAPLKITDLRYNQKKRLFVKPSSKAGLLLHPKKDIIQDYLHLDLSSGILVSISPKNSKEWHRSQYTLALLDLNAPRLVNSRLAYIIYFKKTLKQLQDVLECQNLVELQSLFATIAPLINWTNRFEVEQRKILQATAQHLLNQPHQSILNRLCSELPNALEIQSLLKQV